MIGVQDWLAPLLGSLFVLVVPLIAALMCNTIINRMRSDDLRAHEHRLDRKQLPNRKDDERARIKVDAQWDKIESYTRGRNVCLLVSLAVIEINAALIVLAFTGHSPVLSLSLLAVLIVVLVVAIRAALRKPKRPVWATTIGYYRDLATGNTGKDHEEESA